jgi:hypothetical protein
MLGSLTANASGKTHMRMEAIAAVGRAADLEAQTMDALQGRRGGCPLNQKFDFS